MGSALKPMELNPATVVHTSDKMNNIFIIDFMVVSFPENVRSQF
jgi:hypothetical protein